jgi:hypothetical protein
MSLWMKSAWTSPSLLPVQVCLVLTLPASELMSCARLAPWRERRPMFRGLVTG